MSIGNLATGSYKSIAPGTNTNVKSGQGALLGVYASAAGSMQLYDDSATGTATPIGGSLPLAAGWNNLPINFANGLAANLTTATGLFVYV